jgi:uncharacterized protein YbjT (DUF2867 family)
MRILITGATGFIGAQITATLLQAGHNIVAAVRKKPANSTRFTDIIYCDFNKDSDPAIWLPRLKKIDVVINCVGILQETFRQSISAIHTQTPIALFEACKKANVKRIIHISALGADDAADTMYASTKKAAENHLKKMKIDWVILRPSLVYASGSYGGASLMRGTAALPGFIPVLKKVDPCFMPIHLEDLAQAVRVLVEKPEKIREIFDATSARPVPYSEILQTFRQWLGFGKAKLFRIPVALIRFASKVGDWLKIGPLNSTALNMLLYGNQTTEQRAKRFAEIIGFTPRDFITALQHTPSYVQDRWHARLFFLQPVLRIMLSLFWIGSGLLILHAFNHVTSPLASIILSLIAGCELILGTLSFINWRIRIVLSLQFIFLLLYTITATFFTPQLWLDPLAPLLKNLVLLIATLVMFAIAEDR